MKNKNDINILIVDDRQDNLLVLESLLEDMDCNIIKATSGNEALSLMFDYEFALVLLDVQMPEMNGFEVAEFMRMNSKTRYVPIIFVTAISKEQKCIFKGYEIGAVDYLFKPIESIILHSKVKVFLELFNQKKFCWISIPILIVSMIRFLKISMSAKTSNSSLNPSTR